MQNFEPMTEEEKKLAAETPEEMAARRKREDEEYLAAMVEAAKLSVELYEVSVFQKKGQYGKIVFLAELLTAKEQAVAACIYDRFDCEFITAAEYIGEE